MDVDFFLSRWSFVSREQETVRRSKHGEKAGRALEMVALLGSQGDAEIELESSPEGAICGREDKERCPSTQGQTSCAARSSTHNEGDTKYSRRGVPSGRQGESITRDEQGRVAVSWFSAGFL